MGEHYDYWGGENAAVPVPDTGDDTLRERLAEGLIEHARISIESCRCGWGSNAGNLGQSHALHVADVALLPRIRDHVVVEKAELIDLRALFDLQQTRMAEATEAWRAESPAERENVLPDLGDLLTWLLERAERSEAANIKAREHAVFQTGVTSFATAKAWRRQLDILNGREATR